MVDQTDRRRFLFDAGAGLWLANQASAFQAESTPSVRIHIVDEATKRPIAARLRLLDARGEEITPLGRNAQPDKDAVEEGRSLSIARLFLYRWEAWVRFDSFPLRFTAVRGYEYEIAEGTLTADG